MPKFTDLTGRRFARLLVLERGLNGGPHARWRCQCDCGNESLVRSQALTGGQTVSCGCYMREIKRAQCIERSTHGHAPRGLRSRAYIAWLNMIQRCTNPSATKYPQYGARGVKVCDRWREFDNFLADMGKPPKGLTLDRIDVDGHYEPANCRWATPKQQMNNRTTNRVIEYGGRSQTLQKWAEETGISHRTIGNRLDRLGWPIEQALSMPPSPVSRALR